MENCLLAFERVAGALFAMLWYVVRGGGEWLVVFVVVVAE